VPVRNYKSTSPGRRGGSVADFSGLTKKKPERSLTESGSRSGGRNARGRMTARGRGGGHRRRYRRIDFRRDKDGIPGKVAAIEYDPNRSARIALIVYADGEKRYILCPDGLEVGRIIMNGPEAEPEVGNAMPLSKMPLGSEIHNVELKPGKGGQLARSAGVVARLMAREGEYAQVTLPSGEVRMVHVTCRATFGQVSNIDHRLIVLGKAGRNRWLGKRPLTRGMANERPQAREPLGSLGQGRQDAQAPRGIEPLHREGPQEEEVQVGEPR
jgi:large subunit ribosomal protein L2